MKGNNFPKANGEIKVQTVRLIDHDGSMCGVVTLKEALHRAALVGLDLVEISPNVKPPVCKILDYGKFKYETKKKALEAKKKQKVIVVKEMKFKPNIGQGDFDTKIRKIREFLEEGDKVKISLWFKGREVLHSDLGMKLFDRIITVLGDICKIDSAPKMEGKQIMMMVSPNNVKTII